MLTNCADPREKWTSGQTVHPTTDVLCLFSPLPPQHQQHLQPARSPQQELGQSQALPPSNASISFFFFTSISLQNSSCLIPARCCQGNVRRSGSWSSDPYLHIVSVTALFLNPWWHHESWEQVKGRMAPWGLQPFWSEPEQPDLWPPSTTASAFFVFYKGLRWGQPAATDLDLISSSCGPWFAADAKPTNFIQFMFERKILSQSPNLARFHRHKQDKNNQLFLILTY